MKKRLALEELKADKLETIANKKTVLNILKNSKNLSKMIKEKEINKKVKEDN